jgi:hypothetical protein
MAIEKAETPASPVRSPSAQAAASLGRQKLTTILNVVRYVPKFQRQFEQCRPSLSAAQLALMKPLLRLELTPSGSSW